VTLALVTLPILACFMPLYFCCFCQSASALLGIISLHFTSLHFTLTPHLSSDICYALYSAVIVCFRFSSLIESPSLPV
jgi:hypothetical protein